MKPEFRDDDSVVMFRFQGVVWTRCVLRKAMRDHAGGLYLPAGIVAWRPITNGKLRMNRLRYVPEKSDVLARTTTTVTMP